MRATPWTADELDDLARNGDGDVSQLAQEVRYLREWMARTARIVEAQTLDLRSLARGRRAVSAETVDDLRAIATGGTRKPADDREYRRLLGRRPW